MNIVLISPSKKREKSDLFVVGFFEKGGVPTELGTLEAEFVSIFKGVLQKKKFSGKAEEVFTSYSEVLMEASEILVIGLGENKKWKAQGLRNITGKIAQVGRRRKAKSVRILLDSFVGGSVKAVEAAEIFSESSNLASYRFDKYKSKKKDEEESKSEISLEILLMKKQFEAPAQKRINRAKVISNGVLLARDLVNEPGNVMNPVQLVASARDVARQKGLGCQVLGQKELEKNKMGGILAVSRGSKMPPALIILEYGKKHQEKGTVCLVGKGVTFDTGGISIKPSKDMDKMKYDMAGAAAVMGTMQIVADLKLPIHIVGLAAAVENNVSEDPQRPGDIIRMFNGKTVEVLNTDAEGRLILGDVLSYAEKYNPKTIIDLATLTGACAYTFGDKAIGLLGNNQALIAKIKKAGEETGERCWELPLWDEYGKCLKGHHSDLYNIGSGGAGTITATMFLKEFVPKKAAWAHLDIAGTAWCEKPCHNCPKGATGVGVRLLANLLSNWK